MRLFVTLYYYSLLLCLMSAWLSATLISVGHMLLAGLLIVAVIIKVAGMLSNHGKLRTIGIVSLNIIWIAFTVYFYGDHHVTVELTWEIPFFIFLLGVGISIRGRFDE